MFDRSLNFKIILLVIAAIYIGFSLISFIAIRREEKRIFAETERASQMMAVPILNTIYSDMLDERAEMVYYLMQNLRSMKGVEQIEIIKDNGSDTAFSDDKTLNEVQKEYGELRPQWKTPRFPQSQEITAYIGSAEFKNAFNRLKKQPNNDNHTSYIAEANSRKLFTYLVTIERRKKCDSCHGEEKARGVLMITTSLEDSYEFIKESRNYWTKTGFIMIAIISLVLVFSIRRSVLKPIESMARVAGSIAGGDLNQRMTVTSKDEIGELANTINKMASSLDEAKKELDRRLLELYALYNISKVLNTTFETEQLLLRLVSDISKNLDIQKVIIMLLDDSSGELYAASFTDPEKEILKDFRRKVGEGFYGLVAQTGQGRLIKDVDEEIGLPKEDILSPDIRSIISVPFGRRDKILGLLCALKDKPGMFEWHDLELFRAVAENVAVALENARLYQETKMMAITDGLTGLYNHRFFREQLSIEMEKAGRYNHAMSLIILDIDHFKHYNDAHGHPMGDELLKKLAELLLNSIRESDIACRYGGEEFVLILPETAKDAALALGGRVRKAISEHPFPFRETQPLGTLSVSMGVSTFPVDSKERDGLIRKADDALYRAKNEGRNRVVVA